MQERTVTEPIIVVLALMWLFLSRRSRSRTWAFYKTHYWTPKIQDDGNPPS